MREDMYKIIVERPRRSKDGDCWAARLRNDLNGPAQLGMRAGYGYRELNENLAPLKRYIRAQIGRPWNKVFSEICASIDRRNTVQQHIHQHIRDFIATDVEVHEGSSFQEFYVNPVSGLICRNKDYRSWRRGMAARQRQEQAEIDARRRVVDERTLLLRLDDAWFCVVLDELPPARVIEAIVDGRRRKHVTSEPRYDVVLRRSITRGIYPDAERNHLYGRSDVYAVRKRQLSKRELKAHGLR